MNGDKSSLLNLVKEGRVLCHDINQPLTVLCARIDLLLMKMPSEDPYYYSLEQIKESTRSLTELIGQLHNLLKDFDRP